MHPTLQHRLHPRRWRPVVPVGHALAGVTLLAALALAGCQRQEPPKTAGEKLDSAIETTKDKLEDARQSADDAAKTAGTALSDTAITAAVKTRLAADPDLKLLDIGVETADGRATLTGTAPSTAARDRATQIAGAVDGVKGVDNRLDVKP